MGAGISETRRPAGLEWPVVAGLSSGDRPEKSTNGASRRPHDSSSRAPGGLDHERTLADSEQTLADSEQTLADADQTIGEREQSSAERDQVASDRDQAASDRDLAHGVDPDQHEQSRDIRRRTAHERELTATARLQTASDRDATAVARDLAALARDRAAAARDLAMTHRDAEYERDGAHAVTGAEIVMRATEQRKRALDDRVKAAEHRAQAASDRASATADREQGARDREQALADREALARALALSETDPLTGARTRAAGLVDLDHELDRCRRTNTTLVLVYIDVVGLKRLNDSEGHAAGDRLLKRVIARIGEQLRAYDLIIRHGGDEFLCAMSGMTLRDAHERFSTISGALAADSEVGAIRTGFAELGSEETATELVARADGQLIDKPR
jgi:diguanylate cyclase (GGDEF)-like protein